MSKHIETSSKATGTVQDIKNMDYNDIVYDSISECWRENFKDVVGYDRFKYLIRRGKVKEELDLDNDIIKVIQEN